MNSFALNKLLFNIILTARQRKWLKLPDPVKNLFLKVNNMIGGGANKQEIIAVVKGEISIYIEGTATFLVINTKTAYNM